MKTSGTILIVEPSEVVYEGLASIIRRACSQCQIKHFSDLTEFEKTLGPANTQAAVIINPSFIQHQQKQFSGLRAAFPSVKWIAFVYMFMDQKLEQLFDHVITANDPGPKIIEILQRNPSEKVEETSTENLLSEREKDVLIHLTAGLSNKEIADQLNISINTVITHRKNISQKTGIKTVSGLTIYAVLNQIISIEGIR